MFFSALFLMTGLFLYLTHYDGGHAWWGKLVYQVLPSTKIRPLLRPKSGDLRPDSGDLTLILQTPVSQITLNHPIPVIVIFQNQTEKNILIFKNFNLVSPVHYEALDAKDGPVEKRPLPKYDFSSGKDFYMLKPGEALQGLVNLDQYFKFKSSGTYRIRAEYTGFKNRKPHSQTIVFQMVRPE